MKQFFRRLYLKWKLRAAIRHRDRHIIQKLNKHKDWWQDPEHWKRQQAINEILQEIRYG